MAKGSEEDLKIAVLAWISIPVGLAIVFVLDWALHDQMKWVEFGIFSALMFGALALRMGDAIKQARCASIFGILLLLHLGVFVYLLNSGIKIRTAWYVPIVFGEGFVFGLILTGPGGARNGEDEDSGENAGSGTK